MDWASLQQLGIAGISIGALATILIKVLAMLRESQQDYKSFVQENNHTTTELVRECTATIIEVRESIKSHNDISVSQNEVLKSLIERVK